MPFNIRRSQQIQVPVRSPLFDEVEGASEGSRERFAPLNRNWIQFFTALASKATSADENRYRPVIVLSVNGTLGVGSDLTPRLRFPLDIKPTGVRAEVKQAPVGDSIVLKILSNETPWMQLSIPDGQTSVSAAPQEVEDARPIPAGNNIRLDVVQVGTTFPGADLVVLLYT